MTLPSDSVEVLTKIPLIQLGVKEDDADKIINLIQSLSSFSILEDGKQHDIFDQISDLIDIYVGSSNVAPIIITLLIKMHDKAPWHISGVIDYYVSIVQNKLLRPDYYPHFPEINELFNDSEVYKYNAWEVSASESWRFKDDLVNKSNPSVERTIRILANSSRLSDSLRDSLILAAFDESLSPIDKIDCLRAARNFPPDINFINKVQELKHPEKVFGEMLLLHWNIGSTGEYAHNVKNYTCDINNSNLDRNIYSEAISALIMSGCSDPHLISLAYYNSDSLAYLISSVLYAFQVSKYDDRDTYSKFLEIIKNDDDYDDSKYRYAGVKHVLENYDLAYILNQ